MRFLNVGSVRDSPVARRLTIVRRDRERLVVTRSGRRKIMRPRRLTGRLWAAPQLHR